MIHEVDFMLHLRLKIGSKVVVHDDIVFGNLIVAFLPLQTNEGEVPQLSSHPCVPLPAVTIVAS